MDPKSFSTLDPKLKETYERVMGTANAASSNNSSPASAPSAPAPAPAKTADSQPRLVTTPVDTAPTTQPTSSTIPTAPPAGGLAAPTPPTSPISATTSTMVTGAASPGLSPLPQQEAPASAPIQLDQPTDLGIKPRSKIMPMIFIFAGVVFFIIYTVFWLILFNISIPFLPF